MEHNLVSTTSVPKHSDVVIVGSGIVGASIGYNLAKRGHEVAIVERGDFCGEASGANVGLINMTKQDPDSLSFYLARRSIEDIYPTLSDELGVDVRFENTGMFSVAIDDVSSQELRDLTERQQATGFAIRYLSADDARSIEPMIPANTIGASYSPHGGFVYPFSAVAAYIKRASELGASLVTRTEVTGITTRSNRVVAVQTNRGTISTECVINAAGAWAGKFCRYAGLDVPIIPVRGQLLVTEPIRGLARHVVAGVSPSIRRTWAANGLIGSIQQRADFDKTTTLQIMRHFAAGITEMYPALRDVQVIRAWAGLRPASPDGMVVLGRSTKLEGFVIAGGAFDSGMIYGPAMGEIVAGIVSGDDPPYDLAEASPDRFQNWSHSERVAARN